MSETHVTERFVVGDRVRFSLYGRQSFARRHRDETATVVRVCRNNCLMIRWDGGVGGAKGTRYHVDYFERVVPTIADEVSGER